MDPRLKERENEIVPIMYILFLNRMSEFSFWRNYFYNMAQLMEQNPVPKKTSQPEEPKDLTTKETHEEDLTIDDIDVNEVCIYFESVKSITMAKIGKTR